MSHSGSLTRLLAGALISSAGLLLGVLPLAASAAFTNVRDYFELDGNVSQTGVSLDDWSTLNPPQLGASKLSPALGTLVKRTFIADAPSGSIFTGGGSKDDLDLSGPLSGAGGWKYKDGSVPDKDNITNAFAAAYNVGGDLILYAGADRFDNSGDAFMGFWFFKSSISLGAGGGFNGRHTAGDVLVLANFTGGGTTITIQVLEWQANGTLKLIAGDNVNSARCGTSVSPLYCGIANTASDTPPWPYTNKSGSSTYLAAQFLEVGINISQVLKQAGDDSAPCFSSFMAETRSSSSVSATLKDFVLGGFDVCGVRISKTCETGTVAANNASINYPYSGRITNTGFGVLTNLKLTDTPQAPGVGGSVTVSPDFTFFNCTTNAIISSGGSTLASLAAGSEVCYGSTFNTTNNGSTNSISVLANTSATTTTADTSPTATCPVFVFTTGLTATKNCTASLVPSNGLLVVRVDVTGSVTNQGNVAVTGLQVQDTPTLLSTLIDSTTLGAKGSASDTTNFSGYYFPSTPDAGKTTQFSDAAKAKATLPPIAGGGSITTAADAAAMCDLCVGATCRTADGASINSILLKGKK